MELDNNEQQLIEKAIEARHNSYSPYSMFAVGSAVEMEDGGVFLGTNIENAMYGATMCAERVAIYKALSEGHQKIRTIAIVADTSTPTPPCGFCRQVINEFANSDTVVLLANLNGDIKKYKFTELLPESFGPENME